MNSTDLNSPLTSITCNSPSSFPQENHFENGMFEGGYGDHSSPSQPTNDTDLHVPVDGGDSATLTSTTDAGRFTPNGCELEDNGILDSFNFDDFLNYPDESPSHTPVSTASANIAPQRPGANIPSDSCTPPTGPHTRSPLNSTIRDAPSEPTVSTTPEMSMTPFALSAMPGDDGPTIMAQMAPTTAANGTGNENIDPDLLNMATTAPPGSNAIDETSSGHVQANTTMQAWQNSQPDSSANGDQQSTRGSSRRTRATYSKDSAAVGGRTQSARIRPTRNTRPPTQDGANSSHTDSVCSANPLELKTCLLEIATLNIELVNLIRRVIENHKGHKDMLALALKEAFIKFYDKYAHKCKPCERPTDVSLLEQIALILERGVARSQTVKFQVQLLVDCIDREYTEAGWCLGRQIPEESRAGAPLPDAHPQPSDRSPSGKRRSSSQTGTTVSKRSRQSSTQQSNGPAPSESATSASQSEATKIVDCDLCSWSGPLGRWSEHYDRHFPPSFWECVSPQTDSVNERCDFVAYSVNGLWQHYKKTHKAKDQLDPNYQKAKSIRFEIPNAGHERCPYCQETLGGLASVLKKHHIKGHLQIMTAKDLAEIHNHSCSNKDVCGSKGTKANWKKDPHVLQRRGLATHNHDAQAIIRDDGSRRGNGELWMMEGGAVPATGASPLDQFVEATDDGAVSQYTPSKSDVPARMDWMETHLKYLSPNLGVE